jgi:hypothetical protein
MFYFSEEEHYSAFILAPNLLEATDAIRRLIFIKSLQETALLHARTPPQCIIICLGEVSSSLGAERSYMNSLLGSRDDVPLFSTATVSEGLAPVLLHSSMHCPLAQVVEDK